MIETLLEKPLTWLYLRQMKTVIQYSLLGWGIYIVFWLWLVSGYIELGPAAIRVSVIVVVQMFLFFSNLLYFIPRFLDNKNRVSYFMIIGVVLAIAVVGGAFLDMYLNELYPFKFNKFHPQPTSGYFFARLMISVMPLIVSSLISRSIQVRKQKEESLELKNKMLEAETKALKAQINPHFLFNSLNNIYALSQIKSDKTSDAILHLSEILRYVTYDSNQNLVDLKDEIKTIESFILLQALKDDNQSNIRIEIDSANGHYKIAPLLLIPFIENAFKHSNHEDKKKGWIEIKLNAANGKLKLICSNSIGKTEVKDHTGGVGMENVKKRLSLLYPEQHKLNIFTDQHSYKTELEIILNK